MSKYLLPNPTSGGDGEAFDVGNAELYTITVTLSGSPTAVTAGINGGARIVGTEPVGEIASHIFSAAELAADYAIFHISGKPVDTMIPNISFTGGSSPSAVVTVTAL